MAKLFTVRISVNHDDPLYASFSHFICSNAVEKTDPDFEFIGLDAPHIRPYFSCDKLSTHVFRSIAVDDDYFYFKYKGFEYKVDLIKDMKNVAKDLEQKTQEFGVLNITFSSKEALLNLEEVFVAAHAKYTEDWRKNSLDTNFTGIYLVDGRYWELDGKRPKRLLDTVYLPTKTKNLVVDKLTHFLLPSTKELYTKLSIPYKHVFLFEGLPGSGKTSFISALAGHFGYNLAVLFTNGKMDDTVFICLLRTLPARTWLVLEDMDYLFCDRKKSDSDKNMMTISSILNGLDGLVTASELVVFLTTNFKKRLDSALLRPGRVDDIVHFESVTSDQMQEMFIKFMLFEESTEETTSLAKEFSRAVATLNLEEVPSSLLSQYLVSYVGKPRDAIDNVSRIKVAAKDCVVDSTEANMYN